MTNTSKYNNKQELLKDIYKGSTTFIRDILIYIMIAIPLLIAIYSLLEWLNLRDMQSYININN